MKLIQTRNFKVQVIPAEERYEAQEFLNTNVPDNELHWFTESPEAHTFFVFFSKKTSAYAGKGLITRTSSDSREYTIACDVISDFSAGEQPLELVSRITDWTFNNTKAMFIKLNKSGISRYVQAAAEHCGYKPVDDVWLEKTKDSGSTILICGVFGLAVGAILGGITGSIPLCTSICGFAGFGAGFIASAIEKKNRKR